MVIPGTLISLFNRGVLLQGDAGIGKSELALGLIDRGHCLVADDAPELSLNTHGEIIGSTPPGFSGFIEARGIGVINVERLYGAGSTAPSVRLDLILKMERIDCDDASRVAARCGVEHICGRDVPWRVLPVKEGRNMPLLAEILVRIQLLSEQGYDAGADFLARLNAVMQKGVA